MKKLFFLMGMLWYSFLNSAHAQFKSTDQINNLIYGAQSEGCTQAAVTTTGHNRSGPYTAGRFYLVYGYNGSDISAGDALKCVWGTSAIDVTGLGGALVGETIFANQSRIFQVKGTATYISCISKTATMKFDVCPLK